MAVEPGLGNENPSWQRAERTGYGFGVPSTNGQLQASWPHRGGSRVCGPTRSPERCSTAASSAEGSRKTRSAESPRIRRSSPAPSWDRTTTRRSWRTCSRAGVPRGDRQDPDGHRHDRGRCDLSGTCVRCHVGIDGFVSVEVSPKLAGDTDATVAEARDWVKQINRPNLLVKVPATAEGVPAIRRLDRRGHLGERHADLLAGPIPRSDGRILAGLEDYQEVGGDLTTIVSVGSFFVSRFDTEVDPRLEAMGTEEARSTAGTSPQWPTPVLPTGCILDRFNSARFADLGRARSPCPEAAVGLDVNQEPCVPRPPLRREPGGSQHVNTMPLDTIDAYQDHGDPSPQPFGRGDIEQARADLDSLGGARDRLRRRGGHPGARRRGEVRRELADNCSTASQVDAEAD